MEDTTRVHRGKIGQNLLLIIKIKVYKSMEDRVIMRTVVTYIHAAGRMAQLRTVNDS